MPNFANLAPSNVTSRSVQYNGIMVSGPESVRIHWGGVDALQVAANWPFHLDIGTIPNGNFSATITGLNPGFIYYITGSDVAEVDWANTVGSPAKVFSTLNEPQAIPNALSGSRLRAHVRTRLCQRYAEPICPQKFVQSITGNVSDKNSVLPCYSVDNAFMSLDYTKDSSGHPVFTETFSTLRPDGTTFSYSPTDPSHPPNTSQFGKSGLILPTTPLFQGIPFPAQWWIHRKGTWKFEITTFFNAAVPPVGGGSHYPISLWALPHSTLTGEGEQRNFFNAAVLGGSLVSPVVTDAFTTLRSTCYWNIYVVFGADISATPNNTHVGTFSIQATRLAP